MATFGMSGTVYASATDHNQDVNCDADGETTSPNRMGEVACGLNAVATGAESVAVGARTNATGASAIALGNDISATKDGSIIIGTNFKANSVSSDGTNSIAIGSGLVQGTYGADADGAYSIAIGGGDASNNGATTKPAAEYGIALGSASLANARGDMAIGGGAKADGTTSTTNKNNFTYNDVKAERASAALAIGTGASATGRNATAIGTGAKATNEGWATNPSDTQNRADNVAIGAAALANYGGVAAGFKTNASGKAGVAIGLEASAQSENMIAIGNKAGSGTGNAHGIAIGVNAGKNYISGTENVAIGRESGQFANGNTNYALGVRSGQYVSGADNYAMGISNGQYILGNQNTSLGYHVGHAVAGTGNVSIGYSSNANDAQKDTNTNQITKGQQVFGDYNLSFGKDAGQYIGQGTITVNTENKLVKSAVHTSSNNISFGYEANKFDENAPLLTQDNIAMGTRSKASGGNAVAIGKDSKSQATSTVAIGNGAEVVATRPVIYNSSNQLETNQQETDHSVAIGDNAKVYNGDTYIRTTQITDPNNVSWKRNSSGKLEWIAGTKTVEETIKSYSTKQEHGSLGGATAVGHNAVAAQGAAVALGAAHANAINSIAIGAWGNTIFGNYYAETRSDGSFAVGNQAIVDENSAGAQAIGRGATVIQGSAGALALGQSATVQGKRAVAIGGSSVVSTGSSLPRDNSAYAGADNALALSADSRVYQGSTAGIAIGQGSRVGEGEIESDGSNGNKVPTRITGTLVAENGIAIGTGAQALANNAISIGTGNIVRGENSGAIGDPTTITGTGTYTIGNNNGTVSADEAGAFGNNNTLTGNNSRIIGNNNTVEANTSFVMGNNSKALKLDDKGKENSGLLVFGDTALASGNYAIAMGAFSQATKNSAVAIGQSAIANGAQSFAGGYDAQSAGAQSLAIGTSSRTTITAQGAIALGWGANASEKAAVALGKDSTTATNATSVKQAKVGNLTYSGFAGSIDKKDIGMQVSIGHSGFERQLKHLAAGEISETSTDAINGSQLYAVAKAFDNIPVVYTDAAGNKLVKANDGNYYTPDNVAPNGTPNSGATRVDPNSIIASVQNTAGDTITPTTLANIASNLPTTQNNTAASGEASNATTTQTAPTDIKQNNAATVGDVLNAGWNLQENGTAKDFVKPYDTVNFANGTGTTATVENTDGKTSTVKFNVKTTALTTDENGDVSAGTTGDSFANATEVANAINKAVDNTTSQFAGDNGTVTVKRKPSETLTIKGGAASNTLSDNNIGTVGNTDGTITVKLAKTLTGLTSAVFVDAEGNQTTVNGNAITITPKDSTKSPVSLTKNGLDNGGNAITNVNSGLGTISNANNGSNGLTNLGNNAVNDNTVATVGDLRNMGFVVSSDKTTGDLSTAFSSQVKNAGEVKFVGTGGATVSGKTENGVNTITVAVDAQSVAQNAQLPVVYTKNDGTKVYKVGDKFYTTPTGPADPANPNSDAIEPSQVVASMQNADGSTNKPTTLANIAGNLEGAKANSTAPTTQATAPADIKQNNAATVGDVLNAGWNLQENGTAKDFVKPYDTVNFANGTGTTATVENTDGKTSTVKFNVKTTALTTDENGDVSAGTTGDSFANATEVANAINKAVDNTTSQFAGDNGTVTVKRKPSETLTIKGGAASNTLSDNNIGTVGNTDGTITVKLAKTLTDLTSAAFVDAEGNQTTVNGNAITITPKDSTKSPVSLTKNGLDNGGNAITNVNSGLGTISNANNGSNGLTNLGNNAVNNTTVATVGDLRNMGFVVSSDKTTGDLSTAFSSQVKNAGEVKFVGTGGATVSGKTENGVNTITVAVDAQSVAQNAQLPVVYTKNDGTKVYKLADGEFNTQADGKGESVNKENVVASMQNANGSTKAPTTLANIASGIGGNVGNGAGSANTLNQTAGTNSFIDNLAKATDNTLNQASTVGDLKNLADTPMFFSGDNANKTFARKLSQEVKIQGGQTNESKLTDNNIGVVSNGTDTLTVKLAKNIDLGQDGSVTTGATVVNKDGVKITATDPNNTVSLTNQGLSNGGNQITNVASGLSGGDLASATGATLTNAANIGDLKNVVSNITNMNLGGGFGLKDSAGNEAKQNLGKTITIKGELANNAAASAKNIRVDVANNEVIVKLAEDLTDLNSVTIGKGNNTTKLTSTANGLDVGGDKITNVASGFGNRTPDEIKQAIANGDISPAEKTNAANIGDLLALQNAVQNNVTNVTNNYQNILGKEYVDSTGQLTDKGKEALVTYEISGQKERENASIIDALVQVKEQGTKYFHVNGGQRVEGTKTNTEDASASGAKSTAIGYRADAQGENAIAMGNGAKATGKNSIAIGTANIISRKEAGALGNSAIINGDSSYSVGNNNNIQTNSTYAFGSNITQTIENSVFLGDRSSSNGIHTTANGGNYTYAGANDANVAGVDNVKGVVSVGNANETRQIQHVAAGVVSANSTDAINGSQLYDTHRVINHLNQNVHKMDKDLRAGIAGAAALGMQPQPTRPGKSMVSVGGTSYRNQSAVALGVSRVSDNEKWVIKVGASADTRKNYIVGGAVGYQF
ncbi:YadA-like family protein [Avibacterium sp. 21-599]|uniref:YadA-like family protein n=1 Tax=Avibacterium sp. 21-599 TaxID=2911528 RepID=UPI0022481F15|nr:YadA-like family protein [Avibacterium sp. 21-599]MCW9718802.1 YadA-like family protein [Avibacterium sp. 21-599]